MNKIILSGVEIDTSKINSIELSTDVLEITTIDGDNIKIVFSNSVSFTDIIKVVENLCADQSKTFNSLNIKLD